MDYGTAGPRAARGGARRSLSMRANSNSSFGPSCKGRPPRLQALCTLGRSLVSCAERAWASQLRKKIPPNPELYGFYGLEKDAEGLADAFRHVAHL